MGSYYVADVVTGEAITDGDPCVGFLVSHLPNAYPFDKNPNRASLRPTSRFQLQSLPIFGRYADCGMIEPDMESGLAERIAVFMTGSKDWGDLSSRAFDDNEGVTLPELIRRPRRDKEAPKQVYGLALMRRSTYDHLTAAELPAKASVVAGMMTLRTECKALQATGGLPYFSLGAVVMLRGDSGGVLDKGPEELRVLNRLVAHENYGSDFLGALRALHILEIPTPAGFDEFAPDIIADTYGAFWETHALLAGMSAVGAEFKPSTYLGQKDNREAVAALAGATVARAFRSGVARFKDCDGTVEGAKKLCAAVEALEQTAAKARESLESLARDYALRGNEGPVFSDLAVALDPRTPVYSNPRPARRRKP